MTLPRRLLPAWRSPAEPAAHKPVARAAACKPADQSHSPDSFAAVARREERMQAEYTPSFDEKNRRPGYFAAFVLDPDGNHIEAA